MYRPACPLSVPAPLPPPSSSPSSTLRLALAPRQPLGGPSTVLSSPRDHAMPQPKPSLAPPLDPSPRPSTLSKRSFRLSSKSTLAPNTLPDPSSSGLWALLVIVAGSSPVDGRPLDSEIPPDFLCPRLHAHPSAQPSSSSQAPPSLYWVPCAASEAATHSDSSFPPLAVDYSARSRKKRSRRTANIADKYEQYPDGRWRKAGSWELYGSSSCAVRCCPLFVHSPPCDVGRFRSAWMLHRRRYPSKTTRSRPLRARP